MTTVDVSIVMCTRNRADMLRDAMRSLVAQETDGAFTYELLVVDNGSTDGTSDVIADVAGGTDVPVRSVYEGTPGQVVARNRGLREARGEWIANFDDDQIAEAAWLKELMRVARDKQARSVGGKLHLKLPDGCERQLALQVRRLLGESVMWNRVTPYTRQQGPGSGNQLLHSSVFDEIGAYDLSFQLRAYDTDLYRRMREAGIVSWFAPDAIAHHVTPPGRLEESYLRETALHNGWSFGRRDTIEWGLLKPILVGAARIGQAVLSHTPQLWLAQLVKRDETVLNLRCRRWRAEGYARCVLYAAAPSVFRQPRFFSRFEFRATNVPLAEH